MDPVLDLPVDVDRIEVLLPNDAVKNVNTNIDGQTEMEGERTVVFRRRIRR